MNEFELFACLYPSLRRFAAIVADADIDPDDLVQDALAATLSRQSMDEIRHPEAYLKQAMVSLVASRRRRAGTLRRLLPRLMGESVTSDRYPSDLALLDELVPMDRAVIFLIDVEGMSSTETAQQLGLTSAATRKRASRARAKLRTILGVTLTTMHTDPEVTS